VSLLIDEYRRSWAIRFLREARSDLSTADKTPIPTMSVSFAIMAMRKAQTSVYYSLGDPSYLTPMVNEILEGKRSVEIPTMKLLADMELMIRSSINSGERLGKDMAIRNAGRLIELASKMVFLVIRSKVAEFA